MVGYWRLYYKSEVIEIISTTKQRISLKIKVPTGKKSPENKWDLIDFHIIYNIP